MQAASDRTIAVAVLASIVFHALILLALPGLLDRSRKRPSVSAVLARLVAPRPPPAPPEVESPLKPKAAPSPRPAPAAPAAKIARPVPTPSPVAAPVIQAAPVAEVSRTAEPAASPSPPAVVIAPASNPESTSPQATAAASESSDPLTLGQYRIAIIAAAKRYKKYPRLAMDNNWEGQTEIRMVIGADGSIASISVKTRSGFEVLDQQALEMIRKAKPLAPIPAQLRGKGFTVDVQVVFSLKEETG